MTDTAEVEKARHTTTKLKAQLQQARDRSQRNSSNSSMPPSTNPPDAPKPTPKKPSGRKPGGQPGHPPYPRQRLPPERLSRSGPLPPRKSVTIARRPCRPNREPMTPNRPGIGSPSYPSTRAQITEYQGHCRTCVTCGRRTAAKIPDAIRRFSDGPRLAAALAYLSGSPHVSKRGLEEIADTLFQAPIALGTISNLEAEMSAALQPAHTQAQEAVRDATVKNVDETGWKEAGQKSWLWLATTVSVACYLIHTDRGAAGFLALMGNCLGSA